MKSSAAVNDKQGSLFVSEPTQQSSAAGTYSVLFTKANRDENFAKIARLAGRLNASATSDEERKELLSKRESLIEKKFGEGLTRKEELKLRYVSWSLERIEEADYAETFDALERQIAKFERLDADIRSVGADLRRRAGRR